MGTFGVKFWGTRGLVSSPRNETAIFGGNTPCVQILHENHLILVDAGFGITNLGDHLMPRIINNREELQIHILFTHFHWDHTQGLPFFKPIYFNSSSLHLYSPEPETRTLENLDILFDPNYSPFESLNTMQAKSSIHSMKGVTDICGLKVESIPVQHGNAAHEVHDGHTYAFKFTHPNGGSICLVTDHEAAPSTVNNKVVDFAAGCNLLIHDGQYDDQQYTRHHGWGHSTVRQALDNAGRVQPEMTLITHHDPARNDRELQSLHRSMMQVPAYRGLKFEFAREEIEYAVSKVAPADLSGLNAKRPKAG
jgi:phosphoribosyl 1,2-cyclic phosphodiesterase